MTSFTTALEREEDRLEVERLYDESFGGDARRERPIYELRQGYAPVAKLCHVVRQVEGAEARAGFDQEGAGRIVAALRFWSVRIVAKQNGTETKSRSKQEKSPVEKKALLFGPLAVCAEAQGKGFGKALVERNIAEAKRLGFGGILISGVAAYYRPFGFRTLCVQELDMPRPSPGHTIMGLEIKLHFLISAKGKVLPDRCNLLRS